MTNQLLAQTDQPTMNNWIYSFGCCEVFERCQPGIGDNQEILTCPNPEISVKHQLASAAGAVLWHFYAVDKIIRHLSEPATIFTQFEVYVVQKTWWQCVDLKPQCSHGRPRKQQEPKLRNKRQRPQLLGHDISLGSEYSPHLLACWDTLYVIHVKYEQAFQQYIPYTQKKPTRYNV